MLARVDEMLELVGLSDRGDDLVKRYSLGMRQRLGIAAALLKDPALVILDEPANGLDPAGIREIRLLLRQLADEGRTVLVSSHLLGEIEQICDRVAIIARGRTVTSGPVRDVLDRSETVVQVVRVPNLRGGAAALRAAGFDVTHDGSVLRVGASLQAGGDITQTLAAAGHWVCELRPEQASLEDRFLEAHRGGLSVTATFTTLLRVEMRRALARRAVRVLVALALVGTAIAAVIAYATGGSFDPVTASSDPSIWRLADYAGGGGETILSVTVVFLAIGALLGGATVAAADWRAGTMTTLCTWETRRARLLAARFAAIAILAVAISWVLQAAFILAMLPAVLLRGTTDGVDSAWWSALLGSAGREAVVIALAALLGAALATIGRNTTAALGTAFVYLAIVEGIVRGIWPERARWLIGENATIVLTGKRFDDAPFIRDPSLATITLAAYAAAIVFVAVTLFRRREHRGRNLRA